MGLDMRTKRRLTEVTAKRYRKADKKGKGKILDEFCQTTGYNRKYALHILCNWGLTNWVKLEGKNLKLKAENTKKSRKKGGGRPVNYGTAEIHALCRIWEFFDYQCGKLLAPFIRNAMEFLQKEQSFGITQPIKKKLLSISPSTIDRRLKVQKKKLFARGRSNTKPGKLLKNQIPVRAFFSWDERKPGFFEMDTVSHCADNSYGQFCCTLCLTDVFSGWVELASLLNRAHIWVKQAIQQIKDQLPFPLRGLDGDNGGEFINQQLLLWCRQNNVQFTRGRSYRKNDNCFVEQKNGDVVRKAVGYHRYDTPEEAQELAQLYSFLCPLTNYFYPSIKIIGKTRLASGKVKKLYDRPKTPFQRLLESKDISVTVKKQLKLRAAQLNPISLKKLQDAALQKLLWLHSRKGPGVPEPHG